MKKIMISFLVLLHSHLACAETDCIANQYSEKQRPSLQRITKASDFYNWPTFLHFTPAIAAKIIPAKRASLSGPATLVGFDLDDRAWQYDVLSTRWSEGGCGVYQKTTELRRANNVYNFKFWQYTDISYYFGHALVTIPPTMWTNAAHKNGVLSLGTFNLNEINPQDVLDEEHLHKTITTLLDMTRRLGFDGYLINYEEDNFIYSIPLQILMKELREKGLTIIWYDAPLSGGFASYLNRDAIPFLTAAGYFQTDYQWGNIFSRGFPAKSLQTLTASHYEQLNSHVFQMADAYRDAYKSDPFDICTPKISNHFFTRFNDIYKNTTQGDFYTSLGFYAPNWTMFGGKANPVTDTNIPTVSAFESSDAAFWEGTGSYGCGNSNFRNVSYFVEPRTVITHLPFYTSFNTGVGEKYMVNGQLASTGPWSQFTIQSILPTWQNVLLGKSIPGVRAYFDYDTVYMGGASWKMEVKNVSQENVTFRFFKTDFITAANDEVQLVVKPVANETAKIIVNQAQTLPLVRQNKLVNGWLELVFKLPAKTKVTELDISMQFTANTQASLNVGSLKIGNSPSPQNQLVTALGGSLYWLPKQAKSTYRIYGKTQNGIFLLLNEVANTVYDLHGNIFNGNSSEFIGFVIQEVTESGDFVPV